MCTILTNDCFSPGASPTDAELCSGYRRGDKKSGEELIRRYSRLVRSLSRLYYLRGADGDDLAQEAMIGLLRAMREFDPGADTSFKTFAELCIRHNIYSAIRNASRKKHDPLNDYISIGKFLFDSATDAGISPYDLSDPEMLVLDKEAKLEMEQVIEGLLSTFESNVLGYYLKGYTLSEISDLMGKPYKSVDNAITRIRRKLSAYYTLRGDNR